MFGRKQPKKPQTERALLNDALTDLLHDQQVKDRRNRRPKWRRWPAWLDKRLAIGLAAIFVIVIGDGVRRENQEFFALVTNMAGTVVAQPPEARVPRAVSLKQRLEDRTTISTSAGSWAELAFPDGSKVLLDQNTEFRVKLLEYHRGGQWRSRSFFLRNGRVFLRIAKNFGGESEARIYTPSCVAAARGTRFCVEATPLSARVVCEQDAVEVRGYNGDRMVVRDTGQCGAIPGGSPTMPTVASVDDIARFRNGSMTGVETPDPWYKQVELTITQTLDAPLTILGIGRCSWAVGAADYARRTACMEALRKIRLNLEGDASYPFWINPATLEELEVMEEGGVEMLLKSFDGAAIESYVSDGRRYTITARARDRNRTRYELTQSWIGRSQDQN